jgi:hypothetical protein
MLLPLAIVPWIREYLLRSPEFRPLNHLASGGNERRSKATIFGAVVGGEDVSVCGYRYVFVLGQSNEL